MLNNDLLRTALVLAAPFLLPKALKHLQSFLYPRPIGTRTTHSRQQKLERSRDEPRLAIFRLFLVTLGCSISIFTALLPPHNLFLSLSSPHSFLSRLFPLLRSPLDLRLATETLHRLWVSRTQRDLTPLELSLLQRLQTLDHRLAYIAYGSSPLLSCSWCRPSSTTGAFKVSPDYLLAILPGMSIVYLTVLVGMGLLLMGGDRERWRVWAVVAVLAAAGNEVWMRLNWEGLRGANHQGQVSMLNSKIHFQRSISSTLFLLLSYFAPTSPIPPETPTTSSIVTPAIIGIADKTEELLNRLRGLSIERMAILHKDESREKVNEFWSAASKESVLARKDPAVRALLDQRRQAKEGGKPGPTREFQEWVEKALPFGMGGEEEEDERERDEREDESDEGEENQDQVEMNKRNAT